MKDIKKLSQEIINQIAAGEVIERPSSIVKELVDNSIDANSTQISISISDGGIKNITISDNGVGISNENLTSAFEAHSTSKLTTLDDLNSLITMGFRGEALSTIVSIAKVQVVSRTKDSEFGYKLDFDGISPKELVKSASEVGTSISISDIFYNIPARHKFLKTSETEYRKILDILTPYLLIYTNIHWKLVKDGREVYNLPAISQSIELNTDRISKVLKSSWIADSKVVSTQAYGMNVQMVISHPKNNTDKATDQYVYINKRPVRDNGITRSIIQGYSGYIPVGRRVPYIILIDIDPKYIDVNAHPRKEEIRFENPYRMYSYITDVVSSNLKGYITNENSVVENTNEEITSSYINTNPNSQPQYSSSLLQDSGSRYVKSNNNEIRFDKDRSYSIKQSIEFSKKVLERDDVPSQLPNQDVSNIVNVFQIFNKYIVLEFTNQLWMIDQHAAAERITFEKLKGRYNGLEIDIQNTLVPIEIIFNEKESSYLVENKEFLNKLGFNIDIKENIVYVNSYPAYISQSMVEDTIKALVENTDGVNDMTKKLDDVLATIACHSSIRKGQPLSNAECISLYKQLIKCDIPYSCPHGRPAIWKMTLSEIDSNFYRTY